MFPFNLYQISATNNKFLLLENLENKIDVNQYKDIVSTFVNIEFDQFVILHALNDQCEMIIYNKDMSKSEMCGNALRAVAKILLLLQKDQIYAVIKTGDRLSEIKTINEDNFLASLGSPEFRWDKIPLSEKYHDTTFIDLYVGPIDNPVLKNPCVLSMGNPHCVFFVDDLRKYDITKFGSLLENHPLFPQRANISLVEHIDMNNIKMNVWERGVGETLSCGSAACAAVVAGSRRSLNRRTCKVITKGGELNIYWDKNDVVWLSGTVKLYKKISNESDLLNFSW